MQSTAVEVGATEPIVISTGKTGQTVTIKVFRHSDCFFLDWSDDTFKIVGSVVTLTQALTEKDATNAPGIYQLASVNHPSGLDTSSLGLSTTVDDALVIIPAATSPTTKLDPAELRLKALVDGVLFEKVVHSRTNAMARGKVTLSGGAVKPSQDAEYFDENGATSFTNRNTGTERNPV